MGGAIPKACAKLDKIGAILRYGLVLASYEPDSSIEAVLLLLKTAGWISDHRFEKGEGYFLDWTITGQQHAALLQEVVKRHRLADGSRAKQFTAFCSGESATVDDWNSSQVEQDFWLSCLQELGLTAGENKLEAMCEAIAAWQPRLLSGGN